ncbi:NADH dehydrogenase [ubiquinone] 1 alpha subcomplex subunit 5 [Plasmodiophora brassicae]|uniref:NADH dehydrogenase [ubiquinone] 1 alpha subcomplex subunit 5 n=1 Tax=Plasmodiophora brassicae TaxID=37360 RepID=A0A0G4IJB2_PLABS|nr:hypothetical protein PBRA_004059 [Plasmodiophora brassicae]SPQ96260.1 unnamed protein product [Plasmodiophora brassicae]
MWRRAARAGTSWSVRAMSNTKTSTNVTGVPVVPNAREVLLGLYARTLEDVKVIPEHAGYRQSVESFTKFRMQVCQENEDCAIIEDLINDGIVEELIEQAENELKLIPQMAEWKPWETPEGFQEPTVTITGADDDDNETVPGAPPSHAK